MPNLPDTNTVVLLHGFTGSAADWIEIAARLGQHGYQPQRINIIGHGQTSSGNWPDVRDYNMQQVAMRINVMTPSRFHLVGYSMGGRLALYIATRFPEIVQSLILVSASPGLKTEAERTARQKQDNQLADQIEAHGTEWFVNYWEQLALWDTQSDDLKATLHARRLKNSPIGLANSLRGMGTGTMPSLWDDLTELPMPVQLVVGEQDSKFRTINQEMLVLIPNAQLTVIANAGHACHLEAPSEFSDLARNFLDQSQTT